MPIQKILESIIIVLFITGCSPSAEIKGLNDDLERSVEISTAGHSSLKLITHGQNITFFRGFVDKKTKHPSYQMYIHANSGRWMHWNHARFKKDGQLVEYKITSVGHNASCSKFGCAHYEDMVMKLNRKTLEEWKTGRHIVRIASTTESGHQDIEINGEEVTVFLNKIDFILNKLK